MSLGRYAALRSRARSRDYAYLAGQTLFLPRNNWNRIKLPVYGSVAVSTPGTFVTVPRGLSFEYDNPDALPGILPNITLRPTRSSRLYAAIQAPTPAYELSLSTPPDRTARSTGPPAEAQRRRKDAKLDFGLNRFRALANRGLNPLTEFLEFQDATRFNSTPLGLATALAINQGIDVYYGRRAILLRDNIYRNPNLWRLPVGYETLSRLWR